MQRSKVLRRKITIDYINYKDDNAIKLGHYYNIR